jgi:hypothetical protein
MSNFSLACQRFAQCLAHAARAPFSPCSTQKSFGTVSDMAGALSRRPVWFSQTVTLPLLPGLAPPGQPGIFFAPTSPRARTPVLNRVRAACACPGPTAGGGAPSPTRGPAAIET